MCHMWWTLTLTYIFKVIRLDLENRVLSVASTVLDGFFPYLVQMITSMRRCVACDDLWPWPISSRSFDLDFENRVRSVTFSVLDRLFFWLGIQYDSIMWVIMRRRGVSSERRRSSCSSYFRNLLRYSSPISLCPVLGKSLSGDCCVGPNSTHMIAAHIWRSATCCAAHRCKSRVRYIIEPPIIKCSQTQISQNPVHNHFLIC